MLQVIKPSSQKTKPMSPDEWLRKLDKENGSVEDDEEQGGQLQRGGRARSSQKKKKKKSIEGDKTLISLRNQIAFGNHHSSKVYKLVIA